MVQIFVSNEDQNSGPHVYAVSTLLPHSSLQQGEVKFDSKTDWMKNHVGHWLWISGVAVRKFPERMSGTYILNVHNTIPWICNMNRVKGKKRRKPVVCTQFCSLFFLTCHDLDCCFPHWLQILVKLWIKIILSLKVFPVRYYGHSIDYKTSIPHT